MRVFVFVLLFAAALSALSPPDLCDDNCDTEISVSGEPVCVFDTDLSCFLKYPSCSAWKAVKCKNKLDHLLMLGDYCDLENFKCESPKQ